MDKKPSNTKELSYRKSNVIFVLWWVLFVVWLIMMLAFLSITSVPEWKRAVLEFFLLIEVVIIIAAIESYMYVLTIWKNGVILESWILLKHRTEIPYKKINSINIHSIFGLGTLEIFTWNDELTRYKYLAKYDEVEKFIKERMDNKE